MGKSNDETRNKLIKSLRGMAAHSSFSTVYLSSTEEIDLRAQELMQLNFKYHDALHLAFAEAGKVDIFLTTDKRLLNKAQNYQNMLKIKVNNPVIWLMNISQK